MKTLKLISLIWIIALLATLAYRYSTLTITGQWFSEDYGIVALNTDGTWNINGTTGTWKKNGVHTIILNSHTYIGGSPPPIEVSRSFGAMVWKTQYSESTF